MNPVELIVLIVAAVIGVASIPFMIYALWSLYNAPNDEGLHEEALRDTMMAITDYFEGQIRLRERKP